MRKLTLNVLQPVEREKLRLRSVCASVQSGLCLCFSTCFAGLSAIEGLQPLGLFPETGLHGLGLA